MVNSLFCPAVHNPECCSESDLHLCNEKNVPRGQREQMLSVVDSVRFPRYEGADSGPMDRDRRQYEGRNPARRKAGRLCCRSV